MVAAFCKSETFSYYDLHCKFLVRCVEAQISCALKKSVSFHVDIEKIIEGFEFRGGHSVKKKKNKKTRKNSKYFLWICAQLCIKTRCWFFTTFLCAIMARVYSYAPSALFVIYMARPSRYLLQRVSSWIFVTFLRVYLSFPASGRSTYHLGANRQICYIQLACYAHMKHLCRTLGLAAPDIRMHCFVSVSVKSQVRPAGCMHILHCRLISMPTHAALPDSNPVG